jgi:RNA recognition motif-containing protein
VVGDTREPLAELAAAPPARQGYALIEYHSEKDAEGAVAEMNGKVVMGAKVSVDRAFEKGPTRPGR